MDRDDVVEAQIAEDRYEAALDLAKPYMQGTGKTLDEAIEAMRADGFDPDLALPRGAARHERG